jgi:biopolymer transport protein ExbD
VIKVKSTERNNIFNDFIPDLTPLLDVMFLLIFFLILTTNSLPYKIDLDIPKDNEGAATQNKEQNILMVKILANNKGWLIEDKEFANFDLFKQNLLNNHKRKAQQITIMSEASVRVQEFIDLLLFLQKHEIQTADILVKQ